MYMYFGSSSLYTNQIANTVQYKKKLFVRWNQNFVMMAAFFILYLIQDNDYSMARMIIH